MTNRLNMATHFRLAVVFWLLSLVFLPMYSPGDAHVPFAIVSDGALPKSAPGIEGCAPGTVCGPDRAEPRPDGPLLAGTAWLARAATAATRPPFRPGS